LISLSFEDFDLSASSINALKSMKIVNPTPVQEKAIPLIIKGHNIMAQAKTGTGKTLAFIIPIIEKLKFQKNECLILLPTRELAKQVDDVVKDLNNKKVKSYPIYGGVSINNQIKKLDDGIHIIVGTPGRIIDLYKRKKLKFENINYVVLDEADRLWDMGFAPDVKYILSKIKTKYQFMLFSATLDYDIRELVKKFTGNQFTFLNLSRDDLTVTNTRQYFYLIDLFEQKFNSFLKILKIENPQNSLVFVNTKKTSAWLYQNLKRSLNNNFRIGLISGNLSQFQREDILSKFRDHKINMLIATDVAARGLDVENISHVFNYDLPRFAENYVHRIGRTSRMNKKGTAITLCLKDEYEYLCKIEGLINKEIKRKYLGSQEQARNRFPFY
jgi:ATP-dependent RNA helicase DeaD